jgi:serine/threonine protein phosphatase PrpC
VRLSFCHCSDLGLVRPNNQDAFSVDLLDPRGNAALLLVADGMGGYEGGEVASRLAVDTVRTRLLPTASDLGEHLTFPMGLSQSFEAANRAILQAQIDHPNFDSMGTTLTVALIWGERLFIGHIGDSKAILVRGDATTRVTKDHNVAGELVQSGHITVEQAANHPQRHVVTRALGTGAVIKVDQHELNWLPGDILLLYTDGLSSLTTLEEIARACQDDFATLADRLVMLANSRGGQDNITVIAARWEG